MKDKLGREFYNGDEGLSPLELYIKYKASKSITFSLLNAIDELRALFNQHLETAATERALTLVNTTPTELYKIDKLLDELGYPKSDIAKNNTKQDAIRDQISKSLEHFSYAIHFGESDPEKACQALQYFWYHAGLAEGMEYSTSGPMTTAKHSRASKGGRVKSDKYTEKIEAIATLLENESPAAGWSDEVQAASRIAEVIISLKKSKMLNLSSNVIKCYDQLTEIINSNEKLRRIVNKGKQQKSNF